ncbi:MAG: flippase-like domain-containing protein [Pedosphaera parvula]|nr:flippase-like domain-containing protein [Pedosphaera parvula]
MKAGGKTWKVGLRFGICALLLVWIFHAIFVKEGRSAIEAQGRVWNALSGAEQWQAAWYYGPRELWSTLRLIEPMALGISILWVGVTILLGIVRWRMVLRIQGLDLPFTRAGEISLVAQFFNSFLLGSTGGDLLKAYYAARETHHKKAEAVATVFVDRLLGLFSMLLFACLMMLPNLGLLAEHDALGPVAGLTVAMMLACGAVVFLAFWGGLSRSWPQAHAWLRKLPKGELLERSLESCRLFGKHPGFLVKAISLSMVINAACVFQAMTLAWGLGLHISPLALFVIVPIIICISALPITPSGLGVRENLFVLMLAVPEIHIAAKQALSISLLSYAGGLLWSIVGGLVYVSLRETQHLREITADTETNNNA